MHSSWHISLSWLNPAGTWGLRLQHVESQLFLVERWRMRCWRIPIIHKIGHRPPSITVLSLPLLITPLSFLRSCSPCLLSSVSAPFSLHPPPLPTETSLFDRKMSLEVLCWFKLCLFMWQSKYEDCVWTRIKTQPSRISSVYNNIDSAKLTQKIKWRSFI